MLPSIATREWSVLVSSSWEYGEVYVCVDMPRKYIDGVIVSYLYVFPPCSVELSQHDA